MESDRTKNYQPINLESNKVGVASLTMFYIFLNYVHLNNYRKIIKNGNYQNFINLRR